MSDFNPLAPATDRENYAPRDEDPQPVKPDTERPIPDPEPGFVKATPELLRGGGMTVRVWRGARWRTATVTSRRVLDWSIVSVEFEGGRSGTPHITRVAVADPGRA